MKELFSELKRRNVVRVAIAYVVLGWLIIEVIDTIAPRLGMPEWVPTFFIIAVLVGLPIVLLFSWAYEVTPEGVMKTEEVDASASITHSTGRKLDRVIIAALVLVVVFLVYERFTPSSGEAPIVAPQVEEGKPSLAVLPFVNMSSEAEQEYFSDGITEELLNTLAKVPGLMVVARTSVFSYKGQSKDVREIGRELGVTTIVEGSVRKAGDDLRITAQLIRVADGFHLWSETYDRKLVNVFAIQEEIAFAIADALKAPLGLEAGGLVTSRTQNMAAYDLYLKGFGELKQRGPGLADAVVNLRRSLELDPEFGPAWAALAITYQVLPTYVGQFEGRRPERAKFNVLAQEAAGRAIELDPGVALAHQAMGTVHRINHRWIEAENEYLEALAIDPQSASVLEDYNEFLDGVGHWDKSIEYGDRAARLEPFRPVFQMASAYSHLTANNLAEAEAIADRVIALDPTFSFAYILKAEIRVLTGEYEAALAIIEACTDCVMPTRHLWTAALSHIIAGGGPPENFDAGDGYTWAGLVYALVGKDGLFEVMKVTAYNGAINAGLTQYGYSFMDEIRTDPRYKALVLDMGLVDYWRQRGWPSYCWPKGEDDFECGAPR